MRSNPKARSEPEERDGSTTVSAPGAVSATANQGPCRFIPSASSAVGQDRRIATKIIDEETDHVCSSSSDGGWRRRRGRRGYMEEKKDG